MSNYQVNKDGFYGEFGGAYVPEIKRLICPLLKARSSSVSIMRC